MPRFTVTISSTAQDVFFLLSAMCMHEQGCGFTRACHCVSQLPIAVTKTLRKTSSKEERPIGLTMLEVSLHGCLDLRQGTRGDGERGEQSCLCHGNQRGNEKGRAKTQLLSLVPGYSRSITSHPEMEMRKPSCMCTCPPVSSNMQLPNPLVTGVLTVNNRCKQSTAQR